MDIYPYNTEGSLGNMLRKARESKGYSLELINHETKIAKRYLEALEQENFNVFPCESYALGFLRNYGTYLELDINELFSFYKISKLQDQPLLIETPFKLPLQAKIIIYIIIAAAIIMSLGYFFN